jgi:hypothetical protein
LGFCNDCDFELQVEGEMKGGLIIDYGRIGFGYGGKMAGLIVD